MKTIDDPVWTDFILNIGDGTERHDDNDRIQIPETIKRSRYIASWKPFGTTSLGNPLGHPDFFSKMASEDSDNVALILLDVAFYVNRGVLSVHGTSKLQMDDRGQLHAVASDKFKALCTRFRLTPTQVLDSLLWSLYPLGMAVDAVSLRAAIVLCDDNGWQIAKDNLEQTFCAEPTSSLGQYYDQLKFAEEMKLENALNVAIMKAESSEFAIELVKLHQFAALSETTRNRIKQELLKRFANVSAPSSLLDQVKKMSVGAQGYEELNEIATADDGESKQMFGQPGETHFIAA